LEGSAPGSRPTQLQDLIAAEFNGVEPDVLAQRGVVRFDPASMLIKMYLKRIRIKHVKSVIVVEIFYGHWHRLRHWVYRSGFADMMQRRRLSAMRHVLEYGLTGVRAKRVFLNDPEAPAESGEQG